MKKQKDATKKTKEKIKKLILAGKIVAAYDIETLEVKKNSTQEEFRKLWENPEFVDVHVRSFWGPWKKGKLGNQGGVEIAWAVKGIGFGILTVFTDNEGKLQMDTEGCSLEFCQKVLMRLANNAISS
jgi:hypothetical protein